MAVERRLLWRIAVFTALVTAQVSADSQLWGPHIIRQPQNTTFNLNSNQDSVYLDCEAEGTPKPTYSWQKDGVNLTLTEDIYLTGGRLTINTPNQAEHKGYYQCFASNKVGTVMSRPADLLFAYVMDFPPRNPPDVTITEFEGDCISCDIPDYFPGVQVTWFHNNIPMYYTSATRVSFDGRLCFASVSEYDDGSYQCSVANVIQSGGGGTQKLSRSFFVTVESNTRPDTTSGPSVAIDVEDRTALQGEDIKLECFFFGEPKPSLRWSRKDGEIPSKAQLNNNNQELHIPEVDLEDAGEYECTASNDIQQGVKIAATVEVKVPPQWLVPLEDMSADIFDDITLECMAESPDGLWYEWYRNSELLTSRDRHTFSNNQQTLKIVDLERTDTAMYQCVATNDYGFAYSTGQLTVRAIAPTFNIPLATNQPAPRDGTVIIKCQPDAAPKPKFTWYHGDDVISTGGRYTIMEDGNLQISDVMDEDEGSYRCVAKNSEGTAESTGSLVIKEGTSIQERPEEKVITVGSDYTLRCSATTDEVFELAYFWMKGETQIDVEDDEHYEMDGGNLVIKDVLLMHAGLYTCVAQTTVDRAETSATINVKAPPGPPSGVKAEIRAINNEIYANVSWMPGAENYSPIEQYKVESRTNYIPKWNKERDGVSLNAKYTRINNLSPWCTYEFRILAKNELGFGEPSLPSPPVETPQRKPTKEPGSVRGCCGGIGNLKIEWDALPLQEWNAPNLRYVVAWREADSEIEEFAEYTTLEENTTHHVVTGMPAYNLYVVKVRALNDIGMGPWSLDAEVYSYQELPEEVPTNIVAKSSSGSSIKVSWTGIDANSFEGVLGGYKVKYWPSGETIETAQVHRAPGATITSTVVGGLSYNTEYTMVVVAFNGDNENGPDSDEASAKTLKSPPISIPGGLKAVPEDKTSIKVSWSGIKTGSTEEPLTGYKVLYWKSGQFEADAATQQVNAQTTQVIIADLEKTKYLVKVRGFSAGGDGPVSETPAEVDLGKAVYGKSKSGASRLVDSVSVTFLFLLSVFSFLCQLL